MRLFNRQYSTPVPYLRVRYGRLEALKTGRVPYLPYLPYLFFARHVTRTRTRACVPARVHPYFSVWKVWKVWKKAYPQGFQPSIPLPYLDQVWNFEESSWIR